MRIRWVGESYWKWGTKEAGGLDLPHKGRRKDKCDKQLWIVFNGSPGDLRSGESYVNVHKPIPTLQAQKQKSQHRDFIFTKMSK